MQIENPRGRAIYIAVGARKNVCLGACDEPGQVLYRTRRVSGTGARHGQSARGLTRSLVVSGPKRHAARRMNGTRDSCACTGLVGGRQAHRHTSAPWSWPSDDTYCPTGRKVQGDQHGIAAKHKERSTSKMATLFIMLNIHYRLKLCLAAVPDSWDKLPRGSCSSHTDTISDIQQHRHPRHSAAHCRMPDSHNHQQNDVAPVKHALAVHGLDGDMRRLCWQRKR